MSERRPVRGVGAWLVLGSVLASAAACTSSGAATPQQPQSLPSGTELVVVFVAASWCHGINAPGFRDSLASLHRQLAAEAKRKDAPVAFVGVALDWNLDDGIKLLRELGPFDEMIVGDNWANTAAIQYIWRDHPGPPSVPQVIILRRRIVVGQSAIVVGPDTIVARLAGPNDIGEWLRKPTHF